MKPNNFCSCFCSLLLFFAVLLSSGAVQAADVSLTYANFPPASTFPCVQMERWKKEVEARTQGKVSVQTFPGSTLLNAKNMFEGVQQGIADIGCLCMSYQPGVFPMTTVVEQPVGFTSSKAATAVLFDLWKKYQPKEFANVKVLALFATAPTNIMSTQAITSLKDLNGLELRASGGAAKVLELLGAVPVSMPMSETPEALQKGLVKGLLSSLEVLKDFNYAESCRHVAVINAQVYPFAVVMNKDKWDALPQDVQKVFDDLAKEQSLWTGEYMDKHVTEAIAYAKEKYSESIYDFTPAQLQKIAQKLSPMPHKWLEDAKAAGLPAQEIMNEMLTLKKSYSRQFDQ